MQIETAFSRLLESDEITSQFKICLFIDGLDEFKEPNQSFSGLSRVLQSWTSLRDVKLCVSSREEAAILNTFRASERMFLHTMTTSDIERVVRRKLEPNPDFRKLWEPYYPGSEYFLKSLIENAKGVFLWVVVVLNLLEDELATQVATIQGLQRILETAPQELDELYSKTLERVPWHHRRGAYFIFAMMLRFRGHCLAGTGDFPRQLSRTVTPVHRELSTFGLSYILDGFEKSGYINERIEFSVPLFAQSDSDQRSIVRHREEQGLSKLQNWCKNLVVGTESGGVQLIQFTHRSVLDFLCNKLQTFAREWRIDDNWVAE
jgi:hypothetical protein